MVSVRVRLLKEGRHLSPLAVGRQPNAGAPGAGARARHRGRAPGPEGPFRWGELDFALHATERTDAWHSAVRPFCVCPGKSSEPLPFRIGPFRLRRPRFP